MLKASAFVSEKTRALESARRGEKRYLGASASVCFLCGISLLLVPALPQSGAAVLAASWLLLAALLLTLLRPLFYSRGLPDIAMALLVSCLYALSGWVIGGEGAADIGRWWLSFSLAFFLAGISRVLAFARLLPLFNLPLLLVCGLGELTAGTFTFLGWPGEPRMLYWFLGMSFLLAGAEAAQEAAGIDLLPAPPARHAEGTDGAHGTQKR